MSDENTGAPKVKRARKPRAASANSERDALVASVLAAPNSATIARILGKNGKQLRSFVRGTLGVFVSRGDVLTDEHKRAILDKYAPAAK